MKLWGLMVLVRGTHAMLKRQQPLAGRIKRRITCTLSLFLQEFFPVCIQVDEAVMVVFPSVIDQNEAVTSGVA